MSIPFIEENDQTLARREHLAKLAEIVGNVYPNKFERTCITGAEDTISHILAFEPIIKLVKELKANTPEGEKPNPEFKESLNAKLREFGNVRVSGRLAVPPRVMGKAAFVHLSDGIARLQIYVRKQDASVISNDTGKIIEGEETAWTVFKLLDHGDFIGAEGFLFLTNTGELSVHVETFQFLSKAMLPMPDKIHGISDPEIQRRYRYADLIADSLKIEHDGLTTREVFERRAKMISGMRRFLDDAGYIEVETPMLTPKATGAAARPFATHHNALDIPLYARIAPELYLKRLVTGGFEKVYELNRNFRNEGISQRHNPEFTMLEFYCAYLDVNGMMDFCEKLLKESVMKATGTLQVKYGENDIDFSKFERLTMKEAIIKQENRIAERLPIFEKYFTVYKDENRLWIEDMKFTCILSDWLCIIRDWELRRQTRPYTIDDSIDKITILHPEIHSELISEKGYEELPTGPPRDNFDDVGLNNSTWDYLIKKHQNPSEETYSKSIVTIFELFVEPNIIQPTFIIDYPKSISPLSKASPTNPNIAERFELFINGMEVANGFSELNDPQEQYERFLDQGSEREKGDDEAMVMDEDYIRALSYGMPPAAGIGIGIDRLVMLLTNRHSIRDVILFPHMRPIVKTEVEE